MDLSYFKSILEKKCELNPSLPIVLGVSGGPDSLFLLEILVRSGFSIAVAHFNHHLRVESNKEAQMVEKMALNRNCRFILGEEDVKTEANKNKRSIEEQARISRYTYLFHAADEVNAQAVIVAHTANDQVETVLMHFLRGSGLNGLAGMPFRTEEHGWNSTKPLVRPLLSTWREDIELYCQQEGLNPIRDPSNLDSRFHRNRIRNELIPLLEEFNPKLKMHLLNLSRIVQAEIAREKSEFVAVWQKVIQHQNEHSLVINLQEFRSMELSSQRQILRKMQVLLNPAFRDLDFESVERMIDMLVNSAPRGTNDWIAGIHFLLTGNTAILFVGKELPLDHYLPQIIKSTMDWELNSTLSLENGWKITGEIIPYKKGSIKPFELLEQNHAWLDAGKISFPLVVRQWKKGDRVCLFGMGGKGTKLSNFWINHGVPRHARLYYPLICDAKEILWIPGMRISELYRITDNTKKVLHLHLTREFH